LYHNFIITKIQKAWRKEQREKNNKLQSSKFNPKSKKHGAKSKEQREKISNY